MRNIYLRRASCFFEVTRAFVTGFPIVCLVCFACTSNNCDRTYADDLENYLSQAKAVLLDRKSISTFGCNFKVTRTPQGIEVHGLYAMDNDHVRRDISKDRHDGAPIEQIGITNRLAIVGDEARIFSSVGGASIEPAGQHREAFPDFRLLGLSIRNLNNLYGVTLDSSILATFVEGRGTDWKQANEQVAEIPMTTLSKAKNERTESILFDSEGFYRGCRVVTSESTYCVVIVKSADYAKTRFPIVVLRSETKPNGEILEEETVEITDLKLNVTFESDLFEFSSMGVKVGDNVRTRVFEGKKAIKITDGTWDGTKIIPINESRN